MPVQSGCWYGGVSLGTGPSHSLNGIKTTTATLVLQEHLTNNYTESPDSSVPEEHN